MSRPFLLSALLLAACGVGTETSDRSSPQISIDFPAANSTVSAQVLIALTVTDDFGVDEVRILIDGVERIKLFTAPFGYTWNTGQLVDGSSHVIRVEAEDLSGNLAIKSITVTVQNGPQ